MKKKELFTLALVFVLSSSLNAFTVQNQKKTFGDLKASYVRVMNSSETQLFYLDPNGIAGEIFLSYFVNSSFALRWDLQSFYLRRYKKSFKQPLCIIPLTWNLEFHFFSRWRVQPYLSAGCGPYMFYSYAREEQKNLGKHLGIVGAFGIQCFLSPESSFDLEAKYHRIFDFESPMEDPIIWDLGVRVNVLW